MAVPGLDRCEAPESSELSSVEGPGDLGDLDGLSRIFAGVSAAERLSWSTPFGNSGAGGGISLEALLGEGGGGSGRLDANEARLGISVRVGVPTGPLSWADGEGDQSTASTLENSLVGWCGGEVSCCGPVGVLSC